MLLLVGTAIVLLGVILGFVLGGGNLSVRELGYIEALSNRGRFRPEGIAMDTRSTFAAPIIGMLILGALAGCATTTSTSSKAVLPGTDSCLFQVNVRGWKVLDDQTLLIDAPTGGNRYLLKLFHPATALAFQETLGFEDGDGNGQLCATGDSLRIGTPIPQSVPIAAVRLLTAEEVKNLQGPQAPAQR